MTAPATAAAPIGSELKLQVPDAVGAVDKSKPMEIGPKLDEAMLPQIDAIVANFTRGITDVDLHSDAFRAKAAEISQLGSSDIKSAAAQPNALLDRPLNAMGGDTKIANDLLDMRAKLDELNPATARTLHGMLAKLPFGNKMVRYTRQWQSARTQLDAMCNNLYAGQDRLRKDNQSIEDFRTQLWNTMVSLKKFMYMADRLYVALEAEIERVKTTDPQKAAEMTNDLLYPLGQKRQDLITQMAVSVQGHMAMGVIIQTNRELIRGVDRATTTTMSALAVAVTIQQALESQKKVAKSIDAVNDATEAMIAANAEQLRTQAADIYRQSASSGVSLEVLTKAFNDVFIAMDEIDAFKAGAITTMAATVDKLKVEIEKADPYLKRSAAISEGQTELALPAA